MCCLPDAAFLMFRHARVITSLVQSRSTKPAQCCRWDLVLADPKLTDPKLTDPLSCALPGQAPRQSDVPT